MHYLSPALISNKHLNEDQSSKLVIIWPLKSLSLSLSLQLDKMVKLEFGNLGDSFSFGSLKAYLAEFIATLLFVFAGVGSAIAFGKIWL